MGDRPQPSHGRPKSHHYASGRRLFDAGNAAFDSSSMVFDCAECRFALAGRWNAHAVRAFGFLRRALACASRWITGVEPVFRCFATLFCHVASWNRRYARAFRLLAQRFGAPAKVNRAFDRDFHRDFCCIGTVRREIASGTSEFDSPKIEFYSAAEEFSRIAGYFRRDRSDVVAADVALADGQRHFINKEPAIALSDSHIASRGTGLFGLNVTSHQRHSAELSRAVKAAGAQSQRATCLSE